MTMKKSVLPKSKAKTAYGLLSEIAALALAEPKRMAMSQWIVGGREIAECGLQRPACGTVGCIGGWVQVLKQGDATTTLGLSVAQDDELFFDRALVRALNPQTPAHAKAVVKHIRRFQRKYRAQLLAKKV